MFLLARVVLWAKVDIRLEYLHPVKALFVAASTQDISTFDKIIAVKVDNETAKKDSNLNRNVGEYFERNKKNTSSMKITSSGKNKNNVRVEKNENHIKAVGLKTLNNHTKLEDEEKIEDPKKIEKLDRIKDYNDDWSSVMKYNSHFTPHITKDLYKPGYRITNSDVCDDIHENVLVTILVISAPDHFKQREAIRNSWGKTKDNKEVVFSFLVGLSDNTTLDKDVADESAKNGDVIVNNIGDSYQNLSLKTISAFVWFRQFCSKAPFLLKVDDDMFLQVDKLLKLIRLDLSNKNVGAKSILGNIAKKWRPVRNPKSKYLIIMAEYPAEYFPDFATGPGYLITQQAANDIVPVAMNHKYIHLEDVFLTGVVAETLGIKRIHRQEFKTYPNQISMKKIGCILKKTIIIHNVDPSDQIKLLKLGVSPPCQVMD